MKLPCLLVALLLFCACQGTVPQRNMPPEASISAVLVSARVISSAPHPQTGRCVINLEGDGATSGEVYRLPLKGDVRELFLVEPGVYRLSPSRSIFGFRQATLTIAIDGKKYKTPFPRELLRRASIAIRPGAVVPLGTLEIITGRPGSDGTLHPEIRLNESVNERRALVQGSIHDMMDQDQPVETRESAISWSRALQNSLLALQSEESISPTYKPVK